MLIKVLEEETYPKLSQICGYGKFLKEDISAFTNNAFSSIRHIVETFVAEDIFDTFSKW